MAKTSTKTSKIDNIGDLQTILANNLLDLVSKRTNGKLVEQDPNDENASVLLEKIAKAKEEYQKAQKKQVRKK